MGPTLSLPGSGGVSSQSEQCTSLSAHCHLADIIANTFKMGCSGESEIIPELDQQARAMARPPQNISMSVIKDEIEEVFEETASILLSH